MLRDFCKALGVTALVLAGLFPSSTTLADDLPRSGIADSVRRCDVLAAHPLDPKRRATGVAWESLSADSAISTCRQALEQQPGDPGLEFQLGRVLDKTGRQQEALSYYVSASNKQYPQAFCNIGLMYIQANNGHEAVQWYTQGAKLGASECQFMLGELYRVGVGSGLLTYLTKDYEKARYWYAEAQKNGHPDAQKGLAVLAVQPAADTLSFVLDLFGGSSGSSSSGVSADDDLRRNKAREDERQQRIEDARRAQEAAEAQRLQQNCYGGCAW